MTLQDPIPILAFIQRKHLSNDRQFKWLLAYCNNGDHPSNLGRAFQAKAHPRDAKYKFGIQVPRGVKEAFALDKRNDNNLWRDTNSKELKQINDYQTFRQLKKGGFT